MNLRTERQLQVLFNAKDHQYDLRKTGQFPNIYGRWIDQKCTYDVLATIADCIVNYYETTQNLNFSIKDLWNFEYSNKIITTIFKKPNTDNPNAQHEYDKFFAQPIELLTYSGVLNKIQQGRKNSYIINQEFINILELISHEKFAREFLYLYTKQVLTQSNLISIFQNFFEFQDKTSFNQLKLDFKDFYYKNTNIQNQNEVYRIFSKVLNILCFFESSKGTIKGKLSNDIILLDDITYNRINFRDLNKNKSETRSESELNIYNLEDLKNLSNYQEQKAKNLVKKHNNKYRGKDLGEVPINENFPQNAIHTHHMLPKSTHNEYASTLENLILLTPNQHLLEAHPNNNTQIVDLKYQQICLFYKFLIIQDDLQRVDSIYDLNNLIHLINHCLDLKISKNINIVDLKNLLNQI